MMKKTILLTSIFVMIFGCRATSVKAPRNIEFSIHPADFTPLEFLKVFKSKPNQSGVSNVMLVEDKFPSHWIRDADVDSLIKYVNSKDRAYCFLNPTSLDVPTDNAELGGYAITMLLAFKEKKKLTFGHWSCPTTNENDATNLISWWKSRKK